MAHTRPPAIWVAPTDRLRRLLTALLVAALAFTAGGSPQADEPPVGGFAEFDAGDGVSEPSESEGVEPAVLLPTDRGLERQLDRGRRLAADGRWSDAVAVFDELLAGGPDAFLDSVDASGTQQSIRMAAEQILHNLPRAGREAYLLLTRGTAERQLAAAIEAADGSLIRAVARRWFHTPPGRRAAVLLAIQALEAGDPLSAADWCDRLADGDDEFTPTVAVIRSLAHHQAGDVEKAVAVLTAAARQRGGLVRIAGRDESLSTIAADPRAWLAAHGSGPAEPATLPGDWRQLGGRPGRNPLSAASRPLLVPRYRVPLVRHPDEAALLERRRRAAADAGHGLIPAAAPLAVGEYLVTHTPLGILAIDFGSGRRLWLSSAVPSTGAADDDEPAAMLRPSAGESGDRCFDDATSGSLASDGRLVFAVESQPEALAAELTLSGFGGRGFMRAASDWYQGNTLSAYDLEARGAVRWRLPGHDDGDPGRAETAAWYLGPPLVVGDELFVMVERQGEVTLDVLAAADGHMRWSQPLATYDDDASIANPSARGRRLAGLTPAFGGGLVICPVGGGCIVAVDSATRSLAWAAPYPRADDGDPPAAETDPATATIQRGDPCPVVAAGRVLVRPHDADMLLCLDSRTGARRWQIPARGQMRVAGGIDGRVIITTDTAVEAVDLETGRRVWRWPCPAGSHPSGRGILTPRSLILPLDTPEVVELRLADGGLLGRSLARGGGIPGHLIPHRGELISRGIDSLDVFHQEAALEERIETASRSDPADAWARFWRAQIAIERADVAAGLDGLAEAIGAGGFRAAPATVATAVERAIRLDFPAVHSRWPTLAATLSAATGSPIVSPTVGRLMLDACLAAGDPASARGIGQELLRHSAAPAGLIPDPADPALALTADVWLRSRLADLVEQGATPLQGQAEAAGPAPDATAAGRQEPDTAWPPGEVICRRLGRSAAEANPLGGMQSLPVEVVGGREPDAVACRAVFLMGERKLLVTDRLGRPVCEPFPIGGSGGRVVMPWTRDLANLELAALGGRLFIQTASGLACHDLTTSGDPGRPRWSFAEYPREPGGGERWGGGIGSRVARDGGIPLGMRIVEPDDPRRRAGRGLVTVPDGLIVAGEGMVTMLDPATGKVRWERHGIPPGTDWIADAEILCGCTPNGRGSMVLACETGRLLDRCDLPERRRRLPVPGRRIVAVTSIDEPAGRLTARQVRLELVDPLGCQPTPLGDYPGESRAVETGDGRLAVMTATGLLTVLDLADGSVVFQTSLPDMPERFERLIVQSWQDRYLVLAGGPDDDDRGELSPLQPLLSGPVAMPPLSGSIWAVGRSDGALLWPTTATIRQLDLLAVQPEAAPVMIFGRLLQHDRTDRESLLGVVCLDKRTGQAVVDDARLPILPYQAFGCQIQADPAAHTVVIEGGPGGDRLELLFTGRPAPPSSRSSGHPAASGEITEFLRRLGAGLPAAGERTP